VINEYDDEMYDAGLDGDITDPLYEWIKDDLQKTTKEHPLVFGHEPAFSQYKADRVLAGL